MRARRLTFLVTLAWAALLVLAHSLCATSVAAQAVQEGKRVLILFTHQSDQPAQAIVEQAMRSTLQTGSSTPIEIYAEYLDAVRRPVGDYEKELVAQLQRKHGAKSLDLIFAVNLQASQLLLKNRTALFPGTPIVFLVLDQQNLSGLDVGNTTGVWGEVNYHSNMELALSVHPETKRVVVISGVGEWDTYWRPIAQESLRPFEGRVEFSYLIGLTIAELKKELAALPSQTIVLFASNTLDRAGNKPGNLETLRQICPASSAPVYGLSDSQLGLGIVGGRLLSFERLGVEGAQMGLRVLAGEKPEEMAPHGIPSTPMFDWRELRRWNISESRLPPNSIVRFKVPSFWEQYWGRIVGAFILIVLQTSFIAVLLIERRRRRRAKLALDQLNMELERRIADRTAALNNKSQELETFAYSVAHDLKAPLRGIDGYSRLLLGEHSEQLNQEGRSFLETIQTSTSEMSQLIDDLLEYSRLERRELRPGRVEIASLVSTVIEQTKREEPDGIVDFVVRVNGCSVVGDANGMLQALRNYVDNAVKFTRKVPAPRIEIISKEQGNNVVLTVRDNGVGFDMKYHDRIFNIFQRLNPLEDYPGTGVGLAIVRKSMERMGGRAWAESQPGQGATFYLEIPKTFDGGSIDGQRTVSNSAG